MTDGYIAQVGFLKLAAFQLVSSIDSQNFESKSS